MDAKPALREHLNDLLQEATDSGIHAEERRRLDTAMVEVMVRLCSDMDDRIKELSERQSKTAGDLDRLAEATRKRLDDVEHGQKYMADRQDRHDGRLSVIDHKLTAMDGKIDKVLAWTQAVKLLAPDIQGS